MTALKMAWLIFVIALIAALISIYILPAETQIAVHWNMNGEVDRYGSLIEGLLFQPAIMLFILALIQSLKYFEPRSENLAESKVAKEWIALTAVTLMAIILFGSIATSFGYDVPMMKVIVVSIMCMLIVIGNFLSKTKANFFIGIRTPWTLSNDVIWLKTHRLGGRLFILAGIIGLSLTLFVETTQLSYLIIFLVIPAALIPCFYSWYLWRHDNN